MKFVDIINNLIAVLQNVVVLIIALAVAVFLWGIFQYIANYGDESKRKESVQYMIYGIIGLFVMVSVWGLVYFLSGFIGENIGIPQIK